MSSLLSNLIPDETLQSVSSSDERQVILHCKLAVGFSYAYRICPDTFLLTDTGEKSRFLHAFNIPIHPDWTLKTVPGDFVYFTLIFEGLPSDCERFKMQESTPDDLAGFYSDWISRNKTDVYRTIIFT